MSLENDFDIFRACFPSLRLDKEMFARLSGYESSIRTGDNDGFALVSENRLTLIAVRPEKQRQGIGRALYGECEKVISAGGYDIITLGGELFFGAVSGSYPFFEAMGFSLSDEQADMYVDIADYRDVLCDAPARFGFYGGDISALKAAVSSVDDDWTQYFDGSDKYFCAFENDDIISFCSFEEDVLCTVSQSGIKCGSIGCVGTVPRARRRGIGLKTVSLALERLSISGHGRCYIHDTDLIQWYSRLGARVSVSFKRGQRPLK